MNADLSDLVVTDPDAGPRLAFTLNETARLLGVSRQTVARMITAGRLTEVDTGLQTRLIAAWSLRDLIANHSPGGIPIPGSPTSPQPIGAGVVPSRSPGAGGGTAAGDRPAPVPGGTS